MLSTSLTSGKGAISLVIGNSSLTLPQNSPKCRVWKPLRAENCIPATTSRTGGLRYSGNGLGLVNACLCVAGRPGIPYETEEYITSCPSTGNLDKSW